MNQLSEYERGYRDGLAARRKAPPLTSVRLRELLRYDPLTGEFFWLVDRGRSRAGERAGSTSVYGYTVIAIAGAKHQAGRLAFLWMTGFWPKGEADHWDRDRGNNRWKNLRDLTKRQNAQNKAQTKPNKHGLAGVRRQKRSRGYGSEIKDEGVPIHLGTFPTKEIAHSVYLEAKVRLHPSSVPPPKD